LANAAITSAEPSSVIGSAGGFIGIASATPPDGTVTHSDGLVLGGVAIDALSSASSAMADNRAGESLGAELGADKTITPGAYAGGELNITGNLNLDAQGDPSAVFIFRAASTLVTGESSSITLLRGAQACNVYWQIGSAATLGANSLMVGHVIAYAAITTGATTTVQGQLISLTTEVTLGGTSIINNGCAATVVAPVATATAKPVTKSKATPVATATAKPVTKSTATPSPRVPSSSVETGTAVTVTGGELPETASPFSNFLFAGGSLMLIGIVGLATRSLLINK